MKKYFMGVDIGTYESKGVLVGEDLRIAASFAVPHTMDNPRPNYFEQDAEKIWWGDFCRISRGLMESSGIPASGIACVGSSVLGCDCLPVDENCSPLRPAILYGIDARAEPQIARLRRELGEDGVASLFGHAPCSDDVAAKILWVRETEPEIFARTAKFLTGSSYLTAKLTGEYRIDHYLAKSSFHPLYRADGSIDSERCGMFCRADQLAECAVVTDIAGHVTPAAAAQTGLCEGTPVIVGTGDSTAESVAGGLVEPGSLLMQFGSTMFYIYCVDSELEACSADHFPGSSVFTVPGTYAVAGGTNCCGILTRWVRDTFYAPELAAEASGGPNAYSVMAREAEKVAPGSDGLVILPYFYGERSPIDDPQARGVIFGLTGNHGRSQINRAALEAAAYSARQHLRLFEKHGLVPGNVIIAGGGTKNPVWMQIVADVLQKPVSVASDWQTASYGDAGMAAIGCGALEDFAAFRRAMPDCRTAVPDPAKAGVYAKYADIYDSLYPATRALMHDIGR